MFWQVNRNKLVNLGWHFEINFAFSTKAIMTSGALHYFYTHTYLRDKNASHQNCGNHLENLAQSFDYETLLHCVKAKNSSLHVSSRTSSSTL